MGPQKITLAAERNISNWINEKNRVIHHTGWVILRFLFPAVTIGFLLIYLFDVITQPQFLSGLTVFLALTLAISKTDASLEQTGQDQ